MKTYKLIVFTDPLPGRENEYNEWYNNVHLQDLVAVPGFVSAQRFKMKAVVSGEIRNRYLSIYDMETDEPEKAMELVQRRVATGQIVVTEAMDPAASNVGIFETCSEVVRARDAASPATR